MRDALILVAAMFGIVWGSYKLNQLADKLQQGRREDDDA